MSNSDIIRVEAKLEIFDAVGTNISRCLTFRFHQPTVYAHKAKVLLFACSCGSSDSTSLPLRSASADFSPNKPHTVIFTSGDDAEAKKLVIELVNSTGLVAIDLGSLAISGAMYEVGAPLSGIEFHFVRRLR